MAFPRTNGTAPASLRSDTRIESPWSWEAVFQIRPAEEWQWSWWIESLTERGTPERGPMGREGRRSRESAKSSSAERL